MKQKLLLKKSEKKVLFGNVEFFVGTFVNFFKSKVFFNILPRMFTFKQCFWLNVITLKIHKLTEISLAIFSQRSTSKPLNNLNVLIW